MTGENHKVLLYILIQPLKREKRQKSENGRSEPVMISIQMVICKHVKSVQRDQEMKVMLKARECG
jgi:hypothetical protein